MDYVDDKIKTSICWFSETVCNLKRQQIRQRRQGQTTACAPQRIAYCVRMAFGTAMARQTFCTKTLADCTFIREDLLKEYDTRVIVSSECRPILNVDQYDTLGEFPPPAE